MIKRVVYILKKFFYLYIVQFVAQIKRFSLNFPNIFSEKEAVFTFYKHYDVSMFIFEGTIQ